MSRSEGEEEVRLSEGEDGRPCIKWRKKKTVRGIKGKVERMVKEPNGIHYKTDKEGEEYLSERGWEATYQVEKTTSNEYYRKQGRNG